MAKRKNPAAVELGRRGGKTAAAKAKAARWAGTTAEERKAIMRKVITARWATTKRNPDITLPGTGAPPRLLMR